MFILFLFIIHNNAPKKNLNSKQSVLISNDCVISFNISWYNQTYNTLYILITLELHVYQKKKKYLYYWL